MRYIRPTSLTWWAGCLAMLTGIASLALPLTGSLSELSRFVAPGSLLTIAAEIDGLAAEIQDLDISGDDMAVKFVDCDSSSRAVLARLDIPSYDHVMVLSYSDTMTAQAADTRTLVTLLHLRQMRCQQM